ncbi:MAG: nicotinamide riboside transporter PnuC [Nanoarchaeota archaeon]|nr:nicotinamide riboside transporter PnuC [Nanoarchaeota archaeon]
MSSWKRNLKKSGGSKTVIVRHFRWDQKVLWFLVSLLAISLYGLFLSYLRGTLPFIDSATTVFSIIATIMLNKRLTDQWFYWIMVDVLSIIMWAYIFISRGADITVLVMWAAFLVNAIYGYYNWRRIEKIQNDKK